MLLKVAQRYLNYKKDILSSEKYEEIASRMRTLAYAIKKGSKSDITQAHGQLESFLDTFPHVGRSALAEYVEVLVVIFAIFVGIRAYIIQPFRIPTGSMQPSLNGIRATILPKDHPAPSFLTKISDSLLKGSSFVHEVSPNTKTIKGFRDSSWFLFTRTEVMFNDGSTISIPAALGEVSRYFIQTKGTPYASFSTGEDIVRACFEAGDLVLVDKISYHFRSPKRGEVFVFDTRGIEGVHRRSGDQAAGAHYIKRLAGLPGDSLSIDSPTLLINGKVATEPSLVRVMKGQAPYNPEGYILASPEGTRLPLRQYMNASSPPFKLAKNPETPYLNEYAALGDNTTSSLDSRYWGPVKQYNLMGPGLFALWPFTSHWGLIP